MSINAANSGFSSKAGGGGGGGKVSGKGTYPHLAMWLSPNTLGDSGAEYDPISGFFSLNKPVSTNLFSIELQTNYPDYYFLLKNYNNNIVILRSGGLIITDDNIGMDFTNISNSRDSIFGTNNILYYISDFYGSNMLISNDTYVAVQTSYGVFGIVNYINTQAYFLNPILVFGSNNSFIHTTSVSTSNLLNIFGSVNNINVPSINYYTLNIFIFGYNNSIFEYPSAIIYGNNINISGAYPLALTANTFYLSYGANHYFYNNINYLSENIINFGASINIFYNNSSLSLYLTQILSSISFGTNITLSYNNFYRLYFANFGHGNTASSNEFTIQDLTISLFGINNYFNSNTSISSIYFRYTLFGMFNQVFNNQLGGNIVIFGYQNQVFNSTVSYFSINIFGISNQIFGLGNIGEVVITGQYNSIGNNFSSNTNVFTVSIYGLRNILNTLSTNNINNVLLFTNYFSLLQSELSYFTAIGSYISVGSIANLSGLFVFGNNISIRNINLSNIFIFKNSPNLVTISTTIPPYNIPNNSYVFIDYNTGEPSVCITPNNRVGIGNSSISAFPQEQLTVEGRIRSVSSDIVVETDTRGFILKAPNGNYWRIQVDNLGILTTTNLGNTLPSEF